MKNKANGPSDCLVTEMQKSLPTETVYEVAYWFEKRFRGRCRAGIFFVQCFSRSQTRSLRRDFPDSSQSGTQRFWWICCTRRWSRLSGGAWSWEPREESTANICRRMAGGSWNRFAAGILQIQYGELGRENGVRRGQTRSGIKDSHPDRCPRTCGGSSAGRDAGCAWLGLLRE